MGILELHGNIAEKVVYCKEGLIPRGMLCFRGPVKLFACLEEAASAVGSGLIEKGTAIAVFPEEDGCSGAPELEKAICGHGLRGEICLITDEDPGMTPGTAAVFFYGSREARKASGAGILAGDDVIEYDIAKRTINADVTPEGALHRASGGDPDDLIVTELGRGTWALTERYSRMFLLSGGEKSLLIDSAFGINDIKSAAERLCGGVDAVWLTHGHWDHIGGAAQFERVFMNAGDRFLIPGDCAGLRPHDLKDGDVLDLGGRRIEAIACPGHTPGGMCFLDRDQRLLFAGDSVAEGPTYLFLDHCSAAELLGGLKGLLGRRGEYDVIYSSHRKMVLDAGYIEDMINCVEMALSGSLEGEPACVARTQGSCKKYSYGKVSVFLP